MPSHPVRCCFFFDKGVCTIDATELERLVKGHMRRPTELNWNLFWKHLHGRTIPGGEPDTTAVEAAADPEPVVEATPAETDPPTESGDAEGAGEAAEEGGVPSPDGG